MIHYLMMIIILYFYNMSLISRYISYYHKNENKNNIGVNKLTGMFQNEPSFTITFKELPNQLGYTKPECSAG